MDREDRLQSFQEFWPYYVREHERGGTQLLHFIGSTAGLICLVAAVATGRWWLLIAGLAIGYGLAWIGHFFIERNRPATFKYPLWSFLADWKMWAYIISGRMGAEVARVRGN